MRGVHAEPLQDAFGDGAPGLVGLGCGTFGAHRVLPRRAERCFRGAQRRDPPRRRG